MSVQGYMDVVNAHKNVGFNPYVILRRFMTLVLFFQKMQFFKNCNKIAFKKKLKELLFFLI